MKNLPDKWKLLLKIFFELLLFITGTFSILSRYFPPQSITFHYAIIPRSKNI